MITTTDFSRNQTRTRVLSLLVSTVAHEIETKLFLGSRNTARLLLTAQLGKLLFSGISTERTVRLRSLQFPALFGVAQHQGRGGLGPLRGLPGRRVCSELGAGAGFSQYFTLDGTDGPFYRRGRPS